MPFTWLWAQLFGMTGLVLASRLFFVAVAFGVGLLAYRAYRALRTALRPVTAAVAVAAPLMALPYHLGQISCNTMPIFGLVLGRQPASRRYFSATAVGPSSAALPSPVSSPSRWS